MGLSWTKKNIFLILLTCLLSYWGYVLWTTHGYFNFRHLLNLSVLTLVLTMIYVVLGSKITIHSEYIIRSILIIIIFFSLLLFIDHGLIYSKHSGALLLFRRAPVLIAVISALSLFFSYKKKPYTTFLIIASAMLIVSHFLTLIVSPDPHIDVFTIFQKASDLAISGQNPYDYIYQDIYDGKYIELYGDPVLVYWPLNLYGGMLFKSIFGDFRYMYLFSLVVSCYGILLLFKDKKIAWVINMLLLSFPVSFFVLEQSWIETLFFPFMIFLCYFLQKERFWAAGIMIGLIAGVKQFILFFMIVAFAYVLKKYGWKPLFKFFTACIITFIIPFLPFIGKLGLIYDNTVVSLLKYKPRTESFSWNYFLERKHNIIITGNVATIIYLCVSLLSVIIVLRKKLVGLKDLMFLTTFIYTVVFVFGKQAFCNYYYFLGFLLIMTTSFILNERSQSKLS